VNPFIQALILIVTGTFVGGFATFGLLILGIRLQRSDSPLLALSTPVEDGPAPEMPQSSAFHGGRGREAWPTDKEGIQTVYIDLAGRKVPVGIFVPKIAAEKNLTLSWKIEDADPVRVQSDFVDSDFADVDIEIEPVKGTYRIAASKKSKTG